jgi:hypothetical protein
MNKDGALTFVAPLEIDAAWGSSKLTFKKNHEAKWDMYTESSTGLLRFSELAVGVHHMVIAPSPHNILSIMDKIQFGGLHAPDGPFYLGSTLSIRSFSRLGSTLSVLDFAHVGSAMSLRSYARLAASVSVLVKGA